VKRRESAKRSRRVSPQTIPLLADLREAIRHLHGCDSRHVESVPVTETWQAETVWDGIVEVFNLIGHPTAKRAYAWSHAVEGSTKRRFVAVLHEGKVDSPRAAVRVAIMTEVKGRVSDVP
jgi:hypothetical protein